MTLKGRLNRSALVTDLYELTMAAGYYARKMFAPATFSLFIRKYPTNRAYLVSAGLEDVLDYLESWHFTQEQLEYLSTLGMFTDEFLHYLGTLGFSGDVYAIPEGRLFFKDEPILEVTAPIIEGQLVESFIINAINLQVSIATKASRCVHEAGGRKLVDFSLRRTQGAEAGLKVARASYLSGFGGTSNVSAGEIYGIPVVGTMAHSFVTSFEDETDAFRAFADVFPDNTVLLIDTYDTVEGAHKAVTVAREMQDRGHRLRGVRLDSGDMAELSKQVREILDKSDLEDVSIFASGGFDEFKISKVLKDGALIDAFGVGTKMGVSADAPYTDMAYKLVEYDKKPVLKLSTGKKTLVSKKQVFRRREGGRLVGDTIALRSEERPAEEALLKPVMKARQRQTAAPSLQQIRDGLAEELGCLGDRYKTLENPDTFPVSLSHRLENLEEEVVHRVREKELGES
jgi:nicotinate phosphoribosyltransferase